MPLNLIKKYSDLLDIAGLPIHNRSLSLKGVFNQDISGNGKFNFRNKKITPTPENGKIAMDTLFSHLTTVITDKKTNQREFDIHRSQRLHWVKHHIEEKKPNQMLCFSVKEPEGNRTYVYDIEQKYVIVLEPKQDNTFYFFLSAYHLRGKDAERNKIMQKYKRRLDVLL